MTSSRCAVLPLAGMGVLAALLLCADGAGYERVEIATDFVSLVYVDCVPSCEATLGTFYSEVRSDMATEMEITASRIQIAGVSSSAAGTYVYFTVAQQTDSTASERAPAEAISALSYRTTQVGGINLGGSTVSRYAPSAEGLPCTHCVTLSETCKAATANAESDVEACATTDLDGLASSCTSAGACSYSSAIVNVTAQSDDTSRENDGNHDETEAHHGEPLGIAFAFLMISLMLGTFVKTLLEQLPRSAYHPPYSVMIFGLGMLCGQIDHSANEDGEFSITIHQSIDYWAKIDPHVIMYGLLPPLLFESALNMDFHVFSKVLYVAGIMALPGVLVSTLLTGCVAMLFFGNCCSITWWSVVLLGSILSATDPVAVVAVLNTLGAPAHLQHMIEGESLLNDGSAVVVFLIAEQMLNEDTELTVPQMFGKFLRLAGGGVLWGLCSGYLAFFWCKLSRHASVIDIAVLVLCIYVVFYLGEHYLHVSGVLASVTFGVLFCRLAPHAMSEHVEHANHVVFSQICHFAETHIFMLAGIIIHRRFFLAQSGLDMTYHVPMSIVLYLVLHIIRASVIGLFTPILVRLGYGLTLGEGVIMTYGGLRGAVSLAMALMLDMNTTVDEDFRDLVVFHTAMVVALTIVINGTTAGALYGWLDMYKANVFRKELRERGFAFLAQEVDTIFAALAHDWFHKPADTATLRKVCPDFKKAKMHYGHIHVPGTHVKKIFFDKNGYVHEKLHHWKRAKLGMHALYQLKMHPAGATPHASGLSALEMPHELAASHDGTGPVGRNHELRQTAPSHLERATSAPTMTSPTTSEDLRPPISFSSRTGSNHKDELCPHLWVSGLPQYQASDLAVRDLFEPFGTVELIFLRSKPDSASTNEPRSWAYITFGGTGTQIQESVTKALLGPVTCKNEEGDTFTLTVQVAEQQKATSAAAINIWEQMKSNAARAKYSVPHSKVITSTTVEEAKMLLYEICFTAVTARYQEMEHHKLIGLKSLDRLQEAIKKGQDVLVQLRDKDLAESQRNKLPSPMYLAWHDDDIPSESVFKQSLIRMVMGGETAGRPESMTSVKNYVDAKNHAKELKVSRFAHIEDLMLCAEMAWAVREAHHEVIYHVLHGEVVDTKDAHILKARGQVSQEMRTIVRESEKMLEGMHHEHKHMMRLIHTVIASRATLHIILNKISMLAHKGFFDENDKESLNHVIEERLLQLEKAFSHGILELTYLELKRKCCHREPTTAREQISRQRQTQGRDLSGPPPPSPAGTRSRVETIHEEEDEADTETDEPELLPKRGLAALAP